MVKKINDSVFLITSGISSLLVLSGLGIYNLINKSRTIEKNIVKISKIKVDKSYYKKFYNIIYEEAGLKDDPYGRELEKSIVKIFCKIAKFDGIGLDDCIDKVKFDLLYKKLLEYQFYDAKKNNLI